MQVLVLSDTHIPGFAKALPDTLGPYLRRAQMILHAGDVDQADVLTDLAQHAPVHVAMGNNDGPGVARWGARDEVLLSIEGVSVAMVHDAGPKRGREGRLRKRFPDARLIVFGHSHIPLDHEIDGVRFFNPGSPTWKRRQPRPTFGWLTFRAGRLRSRLVEL